MGTQQEHIRISASDLAAAVGLHPHVHRNSILENTLAKRYPHRYAAAEARVGTSKRFRKAAAEAATGNTQINAVAAIDDPQARRAALRQAQAMAGCKLARQSAQRPRQGCLAAALRSPAAVAAAAAGGVTNHNSASAALQQDTILSTGQDLSRSSSSPAAAAAAAAAPAAEAAAAAAAAAAGLAQAPAAVGTGKCLEEARQRLNLYESIKAQRYSRAATAAVEARRRQYQQQQQKDKETISISPEDAAAAAAAAVPFPSPDTPVWVTPEDTSGYDDAIMEAIAVAADLARMPVWPAEAAATSQMQGVAEKGWDDSDDVIMVHEVLPSAAAAAATEAAAAADLLLALEPAAGAAALLDPDLICLTGGVDSSDDGDVISMSDDDVIITHDSSDHITDDVIPLSLSAYGLSADEVALLAGAAAAAGATVDSMAAILRPGFPTAAIAAALQLYSYNGHSAAHTGASADAAYGTSGSQAVIVRSVSRRLQQRVSTRRGLQAEREARLLVEQQTGQRVIEPNSLKYSADILLTGPGVARGNVVRLQLVGKVDGWLADKSAVVEVKARQGHLFERVRTYDLIQMMSYMFLTGAPKCYFLECFRPAAGQGLDSWSTEVGWDMDFWEVVVVPGLISFVQKLQEVACCSSAQDELLLFNAEME